VRERRWSERTNYHSQQNFSRAVNAAESVAAFSRRGNAAPN